MKLLKEGYSIGYKVARWNILLYIMISGRNAIKKLNSLQKYKIILKIITKSF